MLKIVVPKENQTIKRLNITTAIVQDHVSQVLRKICFSLFENLAIHFDKIVSQGLRRSKTQGSARCGIHCTSSMKVEIQNDEQITVQYYPAHYGHSHLPATDESFLSENSMTIGGINGNSSSATINGHHYHHHHQQQQQQQQQILLASRQV